MHNIIFRACRIFFQVQTTSRRVGYLVPNPMPNTPISQSGNLARVPMPKCAGAYFGQWLCPIIIAVVRRAAGNVGHHIRGRRCQLSAWNNYVTFFRCRSMYSLV